MANISILEALRQSAEASKNYTDTHGGGGGSTVTIADNPAGGVDLTVNGTTKTLANEETVSELNNDLNELNGLFDYQNSVNLYDPSKVVPNISPAYQEDMENPTTYSAVKNYIYLGIFPAGTRLVFNSKLSGNSGLAYGNPNTLKLVGSVQITTGTTEDGLYYWDVPTTIDRAVGIILDNQKDWTEFFFTTEPMWNTSKHILPYCAKVANLGDSFDGSINEVKLDDELKAKINNPLIEPKEIRPITPFETQTNCFMVWNGKVSTSSFWNGYNIAKFKIKCGETLIVKSYSTQGDASNIAMCERFLDGSAMHILYNADDYTENPMIHTATKREEIIWVGYKAANGITASVIVDFDTIITTPVAEVMNNWDSLLRYRYSSAICIGDSLTVGKQPSDSSRDNYPLYLSRMTGMNITTVAQSGATARSWVTNFLNNCDFTLYDCCFICLGTNGDLVMDSDNYNAYISIINKIQTDNPLCQIFLVESLNTNTDTALTSISNTYNLPYLKVFKNSFYWLDGINGQAVSPTHDMEGDPTHLSPMGYLLLARNVVTEMCGDMAKNPQRYNQRFTV